MFDEIPELDKKGLRDFGLITGALFVGIFGLLLPWKFEWAWPIWPWVILAILSLMAFITPMQLRPVYQVWMRFGLIIGSVMSRIILGIVFFLIVTPLGMMMRATGKDPSRGAWERIANTAEAAGKERYAETARRYLGRSSD